MTNEEEKETKRTSKEHSEIKPDPDLICYAIASKSENKNKGRER
ncbi:MAG: hypothetical protein U9O85_03365 [Euryarchaeota archaeon]|nr:hypothetical protein [Euryarchaeota archaeon]